MNIHLEVTEAPSPTDLKFLGDQLTAFNDGDVGPGQRVALAVFVRDEADRVVGGISGYTAWGWLYVQWLWVDESFRGQHMAGRMLDAAEQEAAARGCHGAYIDTFNPRAAKTYQKQGYQTFATLPDFPMGRDRIFLQKRL
ncbi:GNAT family N-acetyltransferase [Phyllobacterium sp.]|nr:GNAT family N-acetyltransferase [Phyllobacterium sp.]